jgi:two-component system chemotaxis response regulator CheY
MKILVVEDDIIQRRYLQTILVQINHEAVVAANGEEAWQRLQEDTQLRIIITDWMMPVLDGVGLIRRVRASDWPHYTYMILLTGKDSHTNMLAGLQCGADDYLTKPFDRDELIARLKIGERILSLETRLQELATHDTLTGLLNRRAFSAAAETELIRASRTGEAVSFILMDLDRFKSINDRYGHAVGDQVLCLAANALLEHKRPYDLVARWGGEEFLIMLPNVALPDAYIVAERMRASLAAAHLLLPEGNVVKFHSSLGVSSTMPIGEPNLLETLIQRADQALYRAKAAGRNQICLADP